MAPWETRACGTGRSGRATSAGWGSSYAAPVEIAVLLAAPLPFLFVLMNRAACRREPPQGLPRAEGLLDGPARSVLLVVQAVVFGLAMGMFRADAAGIHDDLWFVFLNLAVKAAFPLLVLGLVERFWQRASVGTLCQAALAVLTVCMAVAVNLADVPAVAFVVFDFARYVMVVLIFLAATALAHRVGVHPFAVFAAGMGPYVLAVAAGMVAVRVAGVSGSSPSAVLVLDVVCVLMVCSVLTVGLGERDDLRLFSDGSPEHAPVQRPDEIDARCAEIGARQFLTRREVETMALICKGRSKRYIAESLGLSENTVRGYAKTLYTKLGVHSRQELLTLVGID